MSIEGPVTYTHAHVYFNRIIKLLYDCVFINTTYIINNNIKAHKAFDTIRTQFLQKPRLVTYTRS